MAGAFGPRGFDVRHALVVLTGTGACSIKFLEEVESKAEFSDVTACSADMFGGVFDWGALLPRRRTVFAHRDPLLVAGDGAVVYSDGAELVAHNAKTGVQLWRVKAGDNPNNAAGSPVAFGDGACLLLSLSLPLSLPLSLSLSLSLSLCFPLPGAHAPCGPKKSGAVSCS